MNIDASVEGEEGGGGERGGVEERRGVGGERGVEERGESSKNPSTDLTGKGRETIDNERRTTDGE